MEQEFDFNIPSGKRLKKTYLGNLQLYIRCDTLDSLLNDSFDRDMVLGHALPLALKNYSPARYVSDDKRLVRDQVYAYLGYLKNIEQALETNPHQKTIIIDYVQDEIQKLKTDLSSGAIISSQSPLFQKQFIDSNFKDKKNPSNYLQEKGSIIYDEAMSDGRLSGDARIAYANMEILSLNR